MKKSNLALSIFAVLATVGSTFAVKATFFGSGSVYCELPSSTICHPANRVDCRVDPAGAATSCCFSPAVGKVLTSNSTCKTVAAGSKYSTTAVAK